VRAPEPRALRALIFDFDHTLTDFGRWVDWAGARQRLQALFAGVGLDAAEQLRRRRGLTPMAILDAAADEECEPAVAAEVKAAAHRILDEAELAGAPRASLLPGVVETLAFAEQSGLGLAIVSANGSGAIAEALARHGLATRFAAIVGRSLALPMKPAPDMYLDALRRLRVGPGEALAIGDGIADATGAVAAGVSAVGVLGGEGTEEKLFGAGASWVLADLTALPPLLAFWAELGQSHVSD
jgi:HAD superfamily hydrolase (TIGR01509 family)